MAGIDQDVDFVTGGVAPEKQRRVPPHRGERLDQFAHHERLEDGPAQRMVFERRPVTDAEQVTHESGVKEVESRPFAQALAVTAEVRRKGGRQMSDLEGAQPAARRLLRDPGVARQTVQVQFRCGARRRKPQEVLECPEIGDLQDLAEIPLDIGAHVVAEPFEGRLVPVVDPGVEAGGEGVPKAGGVVGPRGRFTPERFRVIQHQRIECGPALEFGDGKRKEPENRGAPGKRLGNRLHQQQILGAGDDEPARPIVLVHEPLEVGEELGCPLDLVEDQVVRGGEQPSGIGERPLSYIGRFQRHVLVVGKDRANEGCLARLAGSRQGDDRICPGRAPEGGSEVTRNHVAHLLRTLGVCQILHRIIKITAHGVQPGTASSP